MNSDLDDIFDESLLKSMSKDELKQQIDDAVTIMTRKDSIYNLMNHSYLRSLSFLLIELSIFKLGIENKLVDVDTDDGIQKISDGITENKYNYIGIFYNKNTMNDFCEIIKDYVPSNFISLLESLNDDAISFMNNFLDYSDTYSIYDEYDVFKSFIDDYFKCIKKVDLCRKIIRPLYDNIVYYGVDSIKKEGDENSTLITYLINAYKKMNIDHFIKVLKTDKSDSSFIFTDEDAETLVRKDIITILKFSKGVKKYVK